MTDHKQAYVRIIAIPPGEAPESVRNAWVGLELPLDGGSELQTVHSSGVLSGPRGFLRSLFGLASGSVKESIGWVVRVKSAMKILAVHAPEAESWWRINAPRLFEGDRTLVFSASCGVSVGAEMETELPPENRITAASSTAKIIGLLCIMLIIETAIVIGWHSGYVSMINVRLWILLFGTSFINLVLSLFLAARLRANRKRMIDSQS